jgi:hypothetical protein
VPGLLASNRNFHRWITQGLPITYLGTPEKARSAAAQLVSAIKTR